MRLFQATDSFSNSVDSISLYQLQLKPIFTSEFIGYRRVLSDPPDRNRKPPVIVGQASMLLSKKIANLYLQLELPGSTCGRDAGWIEP